MEKFTQCEVELASDMTNIDRVCLELDFILFFDFFTFHYFNNLKCKFSAC